VGGEDLRLVFVRWIWLGGLMMMVAGLVSWLINVIEDEQSNRMRKILLFYTIVLFFSLGWPFFIPAIRGKHPYMLPH